MTTDAARHVVGLFALLAMQSGPPPPTVSG
jgi:hypothetical protein